MEKENIIINFLLYIHDVTTAVPSAEVNLFADDTCAFVISKDSSDLKQRLQVAADELSSWFDKWLLSINTEKSVIMLIKSPRASSVEVAISGKVLPQVSSHKHIGLVFNDQLTWSNHVDLVMSRVSSQLGLLHRLKGIWPKLAIRTIYLTCIRPKIEYASVAWSGLSVCDSDRLEKLQRRAARLITGLPCRSNTPRAILLARAGLTSLQKRRQGRRLLLAARCFNDVPAHMPASLPHWFELTKPVRARTLQNGAAFRLPRAKKSYLKNSPFFLSFSAWSSLSLYVVLTSYSEAKKFIKSEYS